MQPNVLGLFVADANKLRGLEVQSTGNTMAFRVSGLPLPLSFDGLLPSLLIQAPAPRLAVAPVRFWSVQLVIHHPVRISLSCHVWCLLREAVFCIGLPLPSFLAGSRFRTWEEEVAPVARRHHPEKLHTRAPVKHLHES